MLAAAEAAIDSGSSLGSEVEHEQLEAYRTTHDLAEAVQGAVMPPLWIVRAGNSGWVASAAWTATAPFQELLDVLSNVGDAIASRLDGMTDERSDAAVEAWRTRNDHDRLKVIEAATGYPPELVAESFLGNEGNEEHVARSLRSRFGVTSELLAWQAKNSRVPLAPRTWQFLSGLVRNPSEFGWRQYSAQP